MKKKQKGASPKVDKPQKPTKAEKNNNKALVVAEEIKFARLLASNDEKIRSKVLKNLSKWLTARCQSSYGFTEIDFLRIWKGLFYYMWMSDKPLVQEQVAESLSKLVHCFTSPDIALLYTKSTMKCLSLEWFGLDRFRVDKFEMLVRRIVRQTFMMCKKNAWDMDVVKKFSKILEDLLLAPSSSLGLILHISNIYMEELAKASNGKVSPSTVTELVRPFAIYLVTLSEERKIRAVIKDIFRYLVFQSDVGIDYQAKFEVWKQAGFPCSSIKDIQKVELSDEEDELEEESKEDQDENESGKLLDPRAGKVHVELPQIPFDAEEIINLLTRYKFYEKSTTKGRKQAMQLIKEFTELSKGEMPLGIKEVEVRKKKRFNALTRSATTRLLKFDNELYSDSSKNKHKRKQSEVALENGIEEDGTSAKKKKKIKSTKNLDSSQETANKKVSTSNRQKSTKTRNKKVSSILSNSFTVNDIEAQDKQLNSKRRYSTGGTWDVSSTEVVIISPLKSHSTASIKEKVNPTIPAIDPTPENPENRTRSQVSATVMPKSPEKTPTKLHETPRRKTLLNSLSKSEPKKKVKIVLHRNTAQNTSEYFRALRQKPSIPFDANRKPVAGVLKPSPLPSPINPFYKRRS